MLKIYFQLNKFVFTFEINIPVHFCMVCPLGLLFDLTPVQRFAMQWTLIILHENSPNVTGTSLLIRDDESRAS